MGTYVLREKKMGMKFSFMYGGANKYIWRESVGREMEGGGCSDE